MEPPSRKNAWEAVDSLCEPLVDSRVPLFEALQNALPVIMEENLDSEEAKRRMPQLLKISRLLIGHLLSTQQQLVADKKNLQEKNRQLKAMQQELTREILSTPSWSFFKCEACQKIFISEKFLQRHLVGRHTQRKKNLIQALRPSPALSATAMQRDVAMADLLLGTPAAGIGVFYVLVFATAEFSRNVVDKVSPNFLKVYFYEIIGTITMCLCVFENGFVLVNYGYLAFLIVVTIVLYTGATMNRGAQVSPLGLFENVYYGGCSFGHFVAIFFAQIISAASAYLLVPHIWFNTSSFLAFHRGKVEEMVKCNVKYKTSFTVLVLFEFFASTLIRVLMPIMNSKAPDTIKSYVIPAFISSMITLSIYVQGAAGLNPIVASSRMLGCDGLDMQLFLFLYWVVTTSGYIFGASISRVFFPAFYKPQKEQWKARPVPKSVKEEISKKQKAANHKSRKAAKQD